MGTVDGTVTLGLAVRSAAGLWACVAKLSVFPQTLSCVGASPFFQACFLRWHNHPFDPVNLEKHEILQAARGHTCHMAVGML